MWLKLFGRNYIPRLPLALRRLAGPLRRWGWAFLLIALVPLVFTAARKLPSFSITHSESSEFVRGFEKGVRFGLVAYINNPGEQRISRLTHQAKYLYWYYEINGMTSIIQRISQKLEDLDD